MLNCSYPSFLKAEEQPDTVISRLIGYQANASSLDHSDLDEAGELHADDISDWGERMIELNRRFGLKILGGCCGTRLEHLRYIVDNMNR
jgi:methionine synthase I (cobalamin-dependent)